jgi:hypothetical protein
LRVGFFPGPAAGYDVDPVLIRLDRSALADGNEKRLANNHSKLFTFLYHDGIRNDINPAEPAARALAYEVPPIGDPCLTG